MAIFRNTRRFMEQAIQNKIFNTPPGIYFGIINNDKNIPKKEKIKINNEAPGLAKNTLYQRRIPDNPVPKSKFYDITSYNHVVERNKVLKTDRNQIINHQVFHVLDGKQQSVKHSGGRLGELSAANEAGFFHKTDKDLLMELKKKVKNKEEEPDAAPEKS